MRIGIKKIYLFPVIILALSFFLTANFCIAALIKQNVKNEANIQAGLAGELGGYETTANIYDLVQTGINAFLSIIGVLLLAYLLYAGYYWMTAQGDEEKVKKAKDTITRAIVGIIIIIGAYAISVFVISRLEAGVLNGGTPTPAAPGPANYQDEAG